MRALIRRYWKEKEKQIMPKCTRCGRTIGGAFDTVCPNCWSQMEKKKREERNRKPSGKSGSSSSSSYGGGSVSWSDDGHPIIGVLLCLFLPLLGMLICLFSGKSNWKLVGKIFLILTIVAIVGIAAVFGIMALNGIDIRQYFPFLPK